MKPDPSLSRSPNFWQTVGLLLSASRRRAAGRRHRQQQLLQYRTGSSTNTAGAFATAMVWLAMAFINGSAAYVVELATSQGQRIEAEQQGKVVVSGFFRDAIRNVEKAESQTEKKEQQNSLKQCTPMRRKIEQINLVDQKKNTSSFCETLFRHVQAVSSLPRTPLSLE
jgi:hypothetical protein